MKEHITSTAIPHVCVEGEALASVSASFEQIPSAAREGLNGC